MSARDEVAELLAAFAIEVDLELSNEARSAAKRALFDAVAVAAGALRHPAARAARRYARGIAPGSGGCLVWGTGEQTNLEAATLANGVLLRCYDFNDLYVGRRSAAHPSDMIAGLVALAEQQGFSGASLLSAIALGYEVTLELLDTLAVAPGGWDYANLTCLGATCALARLMGLDRHQAREALAIAVIPHFASDEIESGDLNARGDLTMWKRFNGADAIRQAVYACSLAACGAEGAVRPFTGRLGMLNKLQEKGNVLADLKERLTGRKALGRITQVTMKRWPVGSRAQSAIHAALAARAKLPRSAAIREVRVTADPSAYEHLVRSRQDPWRPASRETADHSLPYIVASAVLDGYVSTESFAPERVTQPERQRFLQNVKVEPRSAGMTAGVAEGYASAYPARVEIETVDGTTASAETEVAPGHPSLPLSSADLEGKLRESAAQDLDVARVAEALWKVEGLQSMRDLTLKLVVVPGRSLE